jgi:DUF4097 and DUF4098 domain-containing protein YvlB
MKGKWLIAGALILAELLVCAGIMAAVGMGVTRLGLPQLRLGSFIEQSVSAAADEEQRFTVSGPATLSVNKTNLPSFGNVTIVAGPADEVVVSVHKIAWGIDQASAQAALNDLKVVAEQRGDTIVITVDRPEEVITLGRTQPDRVDFTITVPRETTLDAETDFGDVSLTGTNGDAILRTDFGKVSVADVTGGVLDVHSSFGDMTLENVEAGAVTVGSNAGAITLRGVEVSGAVDLSTDFGHVSFETGGAEKLEVKTNSGNVRLENLTIRDAVIAKSDFGTVTLTAVAAASYEVDSNSGTVTIVGAAGPVKVHTDFGDVSVTEADQADIDLSTNSGNIEFAGSLGEGPHVVGTDFGTVHLGLPEDSALTVDLETSFGNIRSDLPITLSGSQDNNHWTGTVNGGGASLAVETDSGSITVEVLK